MYIRTLHLKSKHLQMQVEFYASVLNFIPENVEEKRATFRFGQTLVSFEQDENATPYHFALNIPSNQEDEALRWLQKKGVSILKSGGHNIIDFESWNARSVYFYDKDRNIVELISRKNLNTDTSVPFDSTQVISVSEIGASVENITEAQEDLKRMLDVPVFDSDHEKFSALGDESGLFIIINRNKKNWFPTEDKSYSSPFLVQVDNISLEFRDAHFRFADQLTGL